MRESEFQSRLIKKLERLFPGCLVLKNDSSYIQGIPDLAVFYGDCWAMLEVKASETADVRPNQSYYVDRLNAMSFAAFIYPENERAVLSALRQAFGSPGPTRLPQP
jgi:hypothetical protein